MTFADTFHDRFWAKVDCSGGPDACWAWTAAVSSRGYGQVWVGGKSRSAHRVSLEMVSGPIPDGMFVLHSCDTPACVRPSHLRAGTHEENMMDRTNRGRCPVVLGELNGMSKLTKQAVVDIRERYSNGELQSQLAANHGVAHQTIYDIVNRRSWRHIP